MFKSITTEGKEYEAILKADTEKRIADIYYKKQIERAKNKQPFNFIKLLCYFWFWSSALLLMLTLLMNFDLYTILNDPMKTILFLTSILISLIPFAIIYADSIKQPTSRQSRFKYNR